MTICSGLSWSAARTHLVEGAAERAESARHAPAALSPGHELRAASASAVTTTGAAPGTGLAAGESEGREPHAVAEAAPCGGACGVAFVVNDASLAHVCGS